MPHPLDRRPHGPAEKILTPEELARELQVQADRIGRLAMRLGLAIPRDIREAMHATADELWATQLRGGFTAKEIAQMSDEDIVRLLRHHKVN